MLAGSDDDLVSCGGVRYSNIVRGVSLDDESERTFEVLLDADTVSSGDVGTGVRMIWATSHRCLLAVLRSRARTAEECFTQAELTTLLTHAAAVRGLHGAGASLRMIDTIVRHGADPNDIKAVRMVSMFISSP